MEIQVSTREILKPVMGAEDTRLDANIEFRGEIEEVVGKIMLEARSSYNLTVPRDFVIYRLIELGYIKGESNLLTPDN